MVATESSGIFSDSSGTTWYTMVQYGSIWINMVHLFFVFWDTKNINLRWMHFSLGKHPASSRKSGLNQECNGIAIQCICQVDVLTNQQVAISVVKTYTQKGSQKTRIETCYACRLFPVSVANLRRNAGMSTAKLGSFGNHHV